MDSKELKQERLKVAASIRSLDELCKKEQRTMTPDEGVQFDKMLAELRSYDAQIQLSETVEAETRAAAQRVITPQGRQTEKTRDEIRADVNKATQTYMQHGETALSNEERSLLASTGLFEIRALGSTSATAGAEFVKEEYLNEYEKFLHADMGLFGVCRTIHTSTQGDMPYPTLNDNVEGVIVAQNASAGTPTDPATGEVVFKGFIFSSQPILASMAMIEDDGFNLVGMLPELVADRIGKGFNRAATATGNGTTGPQAIITGAAASGVTTTATTLSRAVLLDLKHSVIAKHRTNAAWMFNDETLALIMKLSIGSADDTPLWSLSLRDGEPDRLLGKPYHINDYLPNLGTTGNKGILFGDFSKYIIRMVNDIKIIRATELHLANYQIGFYGFNRLDGRIVNPNAIKSLAVS